MIEEAMWVPAEEYARIRGLLINIILADDEFDGPGGAIDYARVHLDDVPQERCPRCHYPAEKDAEMAPLPSDWWYCKGCGVSFVPQHSDGDA